MTNEEFLESISKEGEIWKPVVGYEGLYVVSNHSRIATLPRFYRKGKVMNPTTASHGYLYVSLYDDSQKRKYIGVHRIVALAWIPNPNNFPHIDHIDGCRTNNAISNLRWVTRSMNMNNPITKERLSKAEMGVPLHKKRKAIILLVDGKVMRSFDSPITAAKNGYSYWRITESCRTQTPTKEGEQWMYLSDYENLNISDVKELNGIGRGMNPLPLSDSVD